MAPRTQPQKEMRTAIVLFCRSCDSPNTFDRNWVKDDDMCSTCGATGQWRTINEPRKPWAISHNDRNFLRSIRISPDDEH